MPAEQACSFAGAAAGCPINLHFSGGDDSFFVTVPNSPSRRKELGQIFFNGTRFAPPAERQPCALQ
jgi:hypothetical protein